MRNNEQGFTLLESLVGLFLIGIGVLAVAPMFILATVGNDAGGDIGQVGAIAVDRMERLREMPYDDTVLEIGGGLTSNVTHAVTGLAYFDATIPGYIVRWQVDTNATPAGTKVVTVRAIDLGQNSGARRVATLTSLRGG